MVPSDLNAVLGMVERYLASLSEKFGEKDKKQYYEDLVGVREEFFKAIKDGGEYPDQYKTNPKLKRSLYPTDMFPHIFLGTKLSKNPYESVVQPASSMISNGQQWDSPNVWAPNNWILHEVLESKDEKFKVAEQWVKTTYCSWKQNFAIYEKYSANDLGKRGEGGEYEVQIGFGWSNGLALYYLGLYGKFLTNPECE